jgi:hypothetical protein
MQRMTKVLLAIAVACADGDRARAVEEATKIAAHLGAGPAKISESSGHRPGH